MKIDIIGSQFANRLTEFRSFPYDVNIFVTGQSFLSLLSKPYPIAMKDINTTDIVDISTAYRDLNKANLSKLQDSRAEVLMIDILSELNTIVKYENAYFNKQSFDLIDEDIQYENVVKIDQFRAIKKHLNKIIELTDRYEQVILINVLPKNEHDDFISGIYELLYKNIGNKLVVSVDNHSVKDILNAPLEIYDDLNQQLKKLNSDNYENQLLFDEKLEGNIVSVYMNYLEPRQYVYELYKDGQPYKKSHRTDSRYCQFILEESGKYRIRVNLDTDDIKPRFSDTYIYKALIPSNEEIDYKYIEMPEAKHEWMLQLILNYTDIKGIIGNPFKYSDGYKGIDVILKDEVSEPYIQKEDLFDVASPLLENMNQLELENFIAEHTQLIKQTTPALKNYINYLQHKSRDA